MKRVLCAMLIVSLLCSVFAIGAVAQNEESTIAIPADQMEKKFVVDGNLDIWYLNDDDATAEGDGNYYQYITLSPFDKNDGVSYYSDPLTYAQVWTAWDDDYVYIYAKVWDDELVDYDSTVHANSSGADSLEIWFDPDPNSQTHTYTYDENGNITAETEKPKEEVSDGFYNQTGDEAQGDVQIRLIAYDMERHDYHDKVKPGYDGKSFREWVNDPNNFCTFTFEGDTAVVEETGEEVSSGYGVEARFPRNNDSSNSYRFHVAANNSSEESWSHYALATGQAWWMRYDTAWPVEYVKEAPFFIQSEEQLATKGVVYTDSEINVNGPAGKVVEQIKALGTVTADDYDKVMALQAEYDGLTVIEKGYVEYKDCLETLEAAVEAVGGSTTNPDQEAADVVIAKINALNVQSLDDEAAVVAARAAYDALTDAQKELVTNLAKLEAAEAAIAALKDTDTVIYGDVNGDGIDNAADALEILKNVVGKVKFDENQFKAADTDGNNKIEAADALNILKKVVGRLEYYPIEK